MNIRRTLFLTVIPLAIILLSFRIFRIDKNKKEDQTNQNTSIFLISQNNQDNVDNSEHSETSICGRLLAASLPEPQTNISSSPSETNSSENNIPGTNVSGTQLSGTDSQETENLPFSPTLAGNEPLLEQGSTSSISRAEYCLREAIARFDGHLDRIPSPDSLSAQIEWTVFLFDEIYQGNGTYEELSFRNRANPQFADYRNRSPLETSCFLLSLKLTQTRSIYQENETHILSNEEQNFLKIVCDRKNLWKYTSIEGVKKLEQINIEDLSGALSRETERLSDEKRIQMAQKTGIVSPCGMNGLPGLGGISGMLKRLLTLFDFQIKPEQLLLKSNSLPAWRLTGTIKPDVRQMLLKEIYQENIPSEPDALQIPDRVEILIDRERLFPHIIRYYRVEPVNKNNRKYLSTSEFSMTPETSDDNTPSNNNSTSKLMSDSKSNSSQIQNTSDEKNEKSGQPTVEILLTELKFLNVQENSPSVQQKNFIFVPMDESMPETFNKEYLNELLPD